MMGECGLVFVNLSAQTGIGLLLVNSFDVIVQAPALESFLAVWAKGRLYRSLRLCPFLCLFREASVPVIRVIWNQEKHKWYSRMFISTNLFIGTLFRLLPFSATILMTYSVQDSLVVLIIAQF